MNRLVLTEKFLDAYFSPIIRQKGKQTPQKPKRPKKALLDRNGINLETPLTLAHPSKYTNTNHSQLKKVNKQIKGSLKKSLHNFMHSYGPLKNTLKNSNLSNYKLHNSLRKLPKMEKYVLSKLKPLAQKAKNIKNKVVMVNSKHATKEKAFKKLSKKIKLSYSRKKMNFFKELDEFIPSNCEYVKEYLIKKEPVVKEPELPPPIEIMKEPEDSLDDDKSIFLFESKQSLRSMNTIGTRNTRLFDSSAQSKMNLKSSFNGNN